MSRTDTISKGERHGIHSKQTSRSYSLWDKVVVGLSILILLTLCVASLYGFRYGKVDTSVVPGSIAIEKNDRTLFRMHVEEDLTARVVYCGKKMTGTLKLAGASTDSILFQLDEVGFVDGSDATGVIVFVRMPRDGLQGGFVGPWAMYYSWPEEDKMRSDWVFVNEDGSALVGSKKNYNAMTVYGGKLINMAKHGWTWTSEGSRLFLKSS